MKTTSIRLTVNGLPRVATVGPDTLLLDLLRGELGLTGTKKGCGGGECGACTVLLDGKPVASCLLPVFKAAGRSVETVEGLESGGGLHALQRSFVELGAVQCGFCTPGMLLSAKALLDTSPAPSPGEVRRALGGNLCRCTGYHKIVAAVMAAAADLRGERRGGGRGDGGEPGGGEPGGDAIIGGDGSRGEVLGRSLPKSDALPKVRGRAVYADDVSLPGMLFGAIVTSPHRHARIRCIDGSSVLAIPGVVAVLTSAHVPGEKDYGLVDHDQPFLPYDKVRYLHEPVAVVLAESEERARQAAAVVHVEYEVLPAVCCAEEARADGAPLLFESRPGNLLYHRKIRKGDVERGLAEAGVVVEHALTTQTAEHAYLEPEAALAFWKEGRLQVLSGCQSPHYVQREISRMLALPPQSVRVVQTTTGGAFGGKVDLSLQHFVALGAFVTKRPVKMRWTRAESIRTSTKRHSFAVWGRMGVTKEGILTAADTAIVADTGAYASFGKTVITRSAVAALGPYQCPNVRTDGFSILTNSPVAAAMRGFGVPQVAAFREILMDKLADACGLTPFEIRRRNMLLPGTATATQQVLGAGAGALQTLRKVEERMGAGRFRAEEVHSGCGGRVAGGEGIASIFYGNGNTAKPDPVVAVVSLGANGGCLVRCTGAELGQGMSVAMCQIAAHAIGIPVELVSVEPSDTLTLPDLEAGWSPGQTYVVGNAVRLAAERFRRALLARAQEEGRAHLSPGELCEVLAGAEVTLSESARFVPEVSAGLDEETGRGRPYAAYSFATQAASVEVDMDTGQISLAGIVAAHDVGRVLNPLATTAQIEGAVAMGIGYAEMEEVISSESRLLTDGFDTYLLPTIADVPPVEVHIVEVEEASGPFGAKVVGEPATCATAAAIANAVRRATGIEVGSLPLTAEKVYWGIKERGAMQGDA